MTRIFRLVCGGCGYRPGPRSWRRSRPFYPDGNGGALCDRCAYSGGKLFGKEKRRYAMMHPLRAAWLVAFPRA